MAPPWDLDHHEPVMGDTNSENEQPRQSVHDATLQATQHLISFFPSRYSPLLSFCDCHIASSPFSVFLRFSTLMLFLCPFLYFPFSCLGCLLATLGLFFLCKKSLHQKHALLDQKKVSVPKGLMLASDNRATIFNNYNAKSSGAYMAAIASKTRCCEQQTRRTDDAQ